MNKNDLKQCFPDISAEMMTILLVFNPSTRFLKMIEIHFYWFQNILILYVINNSFKICVFSIWIDF